MYVGILKEDGIEVPEEDATRFALRRCLTSEDDFSSFKKEFGKDFVEWYFSGNWIKEEDDGKL